MNPKTQGMKWAAQIACAFVLMFTGSLHSLAQANRASNVTVSHSAETESVVTLPDGKKETRRQPAARVEPGKVVIYTTKLQNQGKDPASQLSLVAPVPANTTLIENGTFGEATPQFSIDQGKSFAPLVQLVVEREGRQRPARLADVTHLRWQPQKPLAPGAVLEMGFKVQVN